MLFDGLSYSLPANKIVPVDLTLRTLRLIGPYDLDKEQETPVFGSRLFTWEFISSNIETAKENERGVIDIETLKQTQQDLIETLEETLKIQQEGRIKRKEAEKEEARYTKALEKSRSELVEKHGL